MTALEALADIPCVDSRKRARDIIDELRTKGFEIRRAPQPIVLSDEVRARTHPSALAEIDAFNRNFAVGSPLSRSIVDPGSMTGAIDD